MNLSKLNISSYRDLTLFWYSKILRTRKIIALFKLWRPQLQRWSGIRSADPPISFQYKILRIGGPGCKRSKIVKYQPDNSNQFENLFPFLPGNTDYKLIWWSSNYHLSYSNVWVLSLFLYIQEKEGGEKYTMFFNNGLKIKQLK